MMVNNPNVINIIERKRLSDIDTSPSARTTKRTCIKNGYTYQMSLYGAVENIITQTERYIRIEIFSDKQYTKHSVVELCELFRKYPPYATYSIWIYKAETNEISNVGKYG